ncbi:MAG: rod shape-determining protein [Ruminococcaceae bacterium]|nr:rod shape-determining protein [Oscillospiraceae bacterium]
MAMGLGIDIGTAQVVIATSAGDVALREPSVIAVSRANGRVLACGQKAHAMLGRNPESVAVVRPIRKGVISDYGYAETMLRHFVRRVCSYKVIKPNTAVTQPSAVTEVEERSLVEAVSAAGVRRVTLMEKAVAALIGTGADITAPEGHMVVDMGAGTTDVAVVSLSGVAASHSLRVGGDDLDEAIVRYVRGKYNHAIGLSTAEWLKCELGRVLPTNDDEWREVKGRATLTGLPAIQRVTAGDVRRAIEEPVSRMLFAITRTMEETLPDLAGDVLREGMILVGGTALLGGLPARITAETGIPCRVAENPTECGAKGAYIALTNPKKLQNSVYNVSQFDRPDELWG